MIVENRSHRQSIYSRHWTCYPDTNSFGYQSSRRRSYAQRLYFEYMYTQKVNGTTFFYTLTYNDKSIPHYFSDIPCFSYADIRLVTNGALSKELLRKYGSQLKYFVACETGEGKGSRGVGKNPHYHCIFFVQPVHKDGVPQFENYKPIQPLDFRRIIRRVWQGSENDYVNFNEARFGICKEGDNCGLVSSIAPFKYCAKYVLKDNNELELENSIRRYWVELCKSEGVSNSVLWFFYLYNNFLQDGVVDHSVFYWLQLDKYNRWRKMTIDPDKSYYRWCSRYADKEVKFNVFPVVIKFWSDQYCNFFPKFKLNEYRRLYSGKVRCSKSLGEYGLNFIYNKDSNPLFNIPTPQGFDCQSISLYYYRKLYYDKHICTVTGNVLYRLNALGKQMKLRSLSNTIEKHIVSVNESLSIVDNNRFVLSFESLRRNKLYQNLLHSSCRDDIIHRYSVYNIVYRYRFYHKDDMISLDPICSFDSVVPDYTRFIENDSYFFDYSYINILRCNLKSSFDNRDFDSHPTFKPYLKFFFLLDELLDCVRSFRSDNSKSIFNANKELASKLKCSRL